MPFQDPRDFGQAHAGTCGHDRQTAATRCAKVRSRLMTSRATRSGWSDNESADVERAHPRYKGRTLRAMNAVQIWAALAAPLSSRFTTAISIVAAPRPSPTTSSADSRLQIATLIVAAMAVLTSAASIYFVRKTGRETTSASRKLANAAEMNAKAADRAATASEASAAAAVKSAQAAEDSVSLSAQTAETADSRAAADALAKRYQNAAEQLGHERATVRIAGVHAMARLADDWVE